MRKHPWYFIIGALVVTASFIYIYYVNKDPDYSIVDYFSDEGKPGKVVFMFIEMAEQDTSFMRELGEELKNNHPELKAKNDSLLTVLIAHFYMVEDTVPAPPEMAEVIMQKYPGQQDLMAKLNYIPDGYIFTGFSRKISGLNVPQDSLFQAPVFVPKKGFKASEIFRRIAKPAPVVHDTTIHRIDTNIAILDSSGKAIIIDSSKVDSTTLKALEEDENNRHKKRHGNRSRR